MSALRPYQEDMVADCREQFRNGAKRIILQLPTGGGKSFIAAYMAKQSTDRGRRVLLLAHRQELISQLTETFTNYGVDASLCQVMMIQTASRRIGSINQPELILCDEGHHSSCKTYTNVFDAFPGVPVVAYSATPCRLSGRPLGNIYDTLVTGVKMQWLIDNGYLCPYQYYAPPLMAIAGLKKIAGEYDAAQQSELLQQRPRIWGDIISHYRKLADGCKTLCFCPTIEYSEKMAEQFTNAGIIAVHLDGETPKDKRKAIMQLFRSGEIKVICSVDILGEGISVDDCSCVILLRRTASIGVFLQQCGRALRYADGKIAKIIDHTSNYLIHGLPADERTWALDQPQKQPSQYNVDGTLRIRQCNTCFFTFPTAPICPSCGASYVVTRDEIQQIKECELQEIKARKDAYKEKYKEDVELRVSRYTTDSECRNLSELQAFAKLTGRKSGWAWHIARIRGMVRS